MPIEGGDAAHDDGLIAPEVGAWAETKHRLVSLYATLFSSGMKAKWSRRVYVELYAGAGFSKIRSTSKFIFGSPLLGLKLKDPFDKYIFCEEKLKNLSALKIRACRVAPNADIAYIQGDCNKRVSEILAEIPQGSPTDTVPFALLIHSISAWSLKQFAGLPRPDM